ncbi:hypothetical protein OQX63_14085 [Pedobacter sp. PF22-3]|uniref:hypothetical protein n=1 Tax=Pedobacter sp. PF22-3 TaxID=2994467 RepID=UPI002247670B|nr:hypothetical protein [Pedobacter sp. PF22-3]MCX2494613.1 hypothetical protein [Pedobacter sp. PF22-3]
MNNLIAISLVLLFASCRSQNAVKFRNETDYIEKQAFKILVADSLEGMRLRAIQGKKPEAALKIAKEQRALMQELCNKIGEMDINNVPEAESFKNANLNYYKLFLTLKDIDIMEAKLLMDIASNDKANAQKATEILYSLTDKRLNINDRIIQAAKEMSNARASFSKANKIY